MKDRLRALRKELKLTQKDFGDKIGIASNTVTSYEKGSRTPGASVIRSICREFNVNEEWLTTGSGEMFIEPDTSLMTMVDNVLCGENEFAKSVFRAFAELSEEEWQLLEKMIEKVQKYKNGA